MLEKGIVILNEAIPLVCRNAGNTAQNLEFDGFRLAQAACPTRCVLECTIYSPLYPRPKTGLDCPASQTGGFDVPFIFDSKFHCHHVIVLLGLSRVATTGLDAQRGRHDGKGQRCQFRGNRLGIRSKVVRRFVRLKGQERGRV